MTLERTIQLATTGDNLTGAWEFVMTHLDEVGPRPRVTVSPLRQSSTGRAGEAVWIERFEVSVSGMVEVGS